VTEWRFRMDSQMTETNLGRWGSQKKQILENTAQEIESRRLRSAGGAEAVFALLETMRSVLSREISAVFPERECSKVGYRFLDLSMVASSPRIARSLVLALEEVAEFPVISVLDVLPSSWMFAFETCAPLVPQYNDVFMGLVIDPRLTHIYAATEWHKWPCVPGLIQAAVEAGKEVGVCSFPLVSGSERSCEVSPFDASQVAQL